MFSEKIFTSRLKALRLEKGLTLEQLGNELQSTKGTFANLENSKKKPSLDMAIKLCNYFNVSSDYLLGLSDDPNRH